MKHCDGIQDEVLEKILENRLFRQFLLEKLSPADLNEILVFFTKSEFANTLNLILPHLKSATDEFIGLKTLENLLTTENLLHLSKLLKTKQSPTFLIPYLGNKQFYEHFVKTKEPFRWVTALCHNPYVKTLSDEELIKIIENQDQCIESVRFLIKHRFALLKQVWFSDEIGKQLDDSEVVEILLKIENSVYGKVLPQLVQSLEYWIEGKMSKTLSKVFQDWAPDSIIQVYKNTTSENLKKFLVNHIHVSFISKNEMLLSDFENLDLPEIVRKLLSAWKLEESYNTDHLEDETSPEIENTKSISKMLKRVDKFDNDIKSKLEEFMDSLDLSIINRSDVSKIWSICLKIIKIDDFHLQKKACFTLDFLAIEYDIRELEQLDYNNCKLLVANLKMNTINYDEFEAIFRVLKNSKGFNGIYTSKNAENWLNIDNITIETVSKSSLNSLDLENADKNYIFTLSFVHFIKRATKIKTSCVVPVMELSSKLETNSVPEKILANHVKSILEKTDIEKLEDRLPLNDFTVPFIIKNEQKCHLFAVGNIAARANVVVKLLGANFLKRDQVLKLLLYVYREAENDWALILQGISFILNRSDRSSDFDFYIKEIEKNQVEI